MPSLSKLYTTKQINKLRENLIAKHGDKCCICRKPRSNFKKNLSVDHSHKSGRIRGLLCFRCNKFQLGRHTIESLNNLLYYLFEYDVPVDSNDEYWETLKAIVEHK
jgi:hypothetical protein